MSGIRLDAQFSQAKIVQISCGQLHTIVLAEDNVYAFGDNSFGQLGIGNLGVEFELQPVSIASFFGGSRVLDVSCGSFHTLVRCAEGAVYSFGRNDYGQLGNDSQLNACRPCPVTGKWALQKEDPVRQLSCGESHSMVMTQRSLFAFGYNCYGQLGDGSLINRQVPVEISIGTESPEGGFQEVRCGSSHSAVRKGDRVFTFGQNEYEQLGDGTDIDRSQPVEITGLFKGETIHAVNCGAYHTAVLTGHYLHLFGNNEYGQLGAESSQVPASSTKIPVVYKGQQIRQVECYWCSTFFQTDNALYSFGNNCYGELGCGNNASRFTPTQIDGNLQ